MSADPAATATQKAPPDGPRSSGSATSALAVGLRPTPSPARRRKALAPSACSTRFARTSVHLQPGDPLGLEDAGSVGAEQPHREPVVDVERFPVDPQGEDGVGVGGVAGVELAASVATLGLDRFDVDGPVGALGA